MNKPVKPVVTFAFFCASLFVLWLSTGQLRNIRAAQQHAPIAERALARYPEFKEVHFGVGTGNGGYFAVSGWVANASQLSRLKILVMATHPPVKVRFYVHVADLAPGSR
jgi:hypothetical protein